MAVSTPRPAHRRWGLVLLVAAGGAVGSSARYALSSAVGPSDGWPVATTVENVVGAFALGLLLEALLRRGPEDAWARRVRLGLGTGVLGGFTTYSTLALETERLLTAGRPGLAAAYALVSVAAGAVAALAGITVAARRARAGAEDAG